MPDRSEDDGQAAAFEARFGLLEIARAFPLRIGTTSTVVLVEIVGLAFLPLLIGLAIDGLLSGRHRDLILFGAVLVGLTFVAVLRRIYDTRAYGSIRVLLGATLDRRYPSMAVSAKNARLEMARELVDFFEQELPILLTGVIQVAVTLIVLASFDVRLALSALGVTTAMIIVYSAFHGRFFRLNAALNEQREQQVHWLGERIHRRLVRHLQALRDLEVRLSDTEAVLYGSIFLLQIGFLIYNLWLGASLPEVTAGKIFSIVTYSWEYVEAATALPMTLQSWSRLHEITRRINRDAEAAGGSAEE